MIALLRNLLPPPMVPGTVHVLDAFPLGQTGKTDRAALRQLAEQTHQSRPDASPERAAPAQLVRTMWEAALMRGDVAETDDFFDLGGHSLMAAQLVAEVREVFGVEFGVRELFESPCLADMIRTIEGRLPRVVDPASAS